MEDTEPKDPSKIEQHEDPLTKALRSMPLNEAVSKLGADVLKEALLDKFAVLDQGRISIEEQLTALKAQMSKENSDLAHRVDKLISLMTNNVVFIRQMIDLLDDYGNKLSKYEKDAAKHQMEYAAVVDRMNRMATNFVKLENNQKEIVEEVEGLKSRQDGDDKFKWKLISIMTLVGTIVGWMCMSDHLKQFIVVMQKALFKE